MLADKRYKILDSIILISRFKIEDVLDIGMDRFEKILTKMKRVYFVNNLEYADFFCSFWTDYR